MAPDVSVVVPVWNPGPDIQRCLDGLAAQTLDHERFEAIFVDDGSTDGTGERLEELATTTPWLRVIREENSGWAGRPRNVGTDAARGRYVHYVDQDDVLPPTALARTLQAAEDNATDVVVGKVTSDFRGVIHRVYRENRARCTPYDEPLINTLTAHKLFRLDFLRRHGIRWAEGPRRLEDQLFMSQVYLTPGLVASIVADTVCYRYLRRSDSKNAGNRRLDPQGYYGNLREVLDAVEERTAPGPDRDRFMARFLQTEVIKRVGAARLDAYPEDYRADMLSTIRTLVDERFPPSTDAQCSPLQRVQLERLRQGDIAGLHAAGMAGESITGHVRLADSRWTSDGLVLDVVATLERDGHPLRLDRDGGDWLLPQAVFGRIGSPQARLVGPDFGFTPVDVVVRHRATRDEWFAGPPLEVDDATPGVARWRGRVVIDPATAAFGRPLEDGVQDLILRVWGFGSRREARIGPVPERSSTTTQVTWARADVGLVQQYVTDHGHLSIDVRPTAAQATRRATPLRARLHGRSLVFVAPLLQPAAGEARVRLTSPSRTVELEATPRPPGHDRKQSTTDGSGGSGDLMAYAVALAVVPPGRYRMELVLRRGADAAPLVSFPVDGTLRMRFRRGFLVDGPGRIDPAAVRRAARKLRRHAGRLRRAVRAGR
jgi:poly(ribitol-phosphate) beta-N-acetylglucosaminyltransferase